MLIKKVYEYALTTGYDISTATFTDSLLVSGQDSAVQAITFNPDGSKMFMVGSTNDKVYEYALSTPFDVSIASFTQSFDLSTQNTGPSGISFNDDGSKMFTCGASPTISAHEYTLTLDVFAGTARAIII